MMKLFSPVHLCLIWELGLVCRVTEDKITNDKEQAELSASRLSISR